MYKQNQSSLSLLFLLARYDSCETKLISPSLPFQDLHPNLSFSIIFGEFLFKTAFNFTSVFHFHQSAIVFFLNFHADFNFQFSFHSCFAFPSVPGCLSFKPDFHPNLHLWYFTYSTHGFFAILFLRLPPSPIYILLQKVKAILRF